MAWIYSCDDPGTTATVWNYWSSGTSASSQTTGGVWYSWCATDSSTAISNGYHTLRVWQTWNTSAGTTQPHPYYHQPKPIILTPEELERQTKEAEARAAEYKKKLEEETRLRKLAEKRAKKLLFRLLKAEQIRDYVKNKKFEVEAPSGTTYRLRHGWAGNVEELDKKGKAVKRFCIHPSITVPYEDNLAAQKLMLETDEKQFLQIANATNLN